MYIPRHFEQSDPALLLEVMQRYNFATLISTVDGAPSASHVPVLARERAGVIHIEGHLAKANPHWRAFEPDAPALIIFHGPHTYISPTLYTPGPHVPTWNYIAVHASGSVRVDHSDLAKRSTLEALIAHHEPSYQTQFEQIAPALRDGMFNAIVTFDMTVSKLEGKFKLGQHRLGQNRPEMQTSHENGDEQQRDIARWMERLGYWSATD